MTKRYALGLIAGLLVAAVSARAEVDPKSLFGEPVALLDASGKPVMTGKAEGSPTAADYDGDGVNDLILGGHLNMNTAQGGIWLARNVGTNAEPRFDWQNAYQVKHDGGGGLQFSCGCKSSGYVPVHPVDWNSDGWMDLVYSDTYTKSWVLINDKSSRERPVFTRQLYFSFEKRNHGMNSGGGDWNADGVPDFLYMPFGGSHYRLFKGSLAPGAKLPRYQDGPRKNGKVLKISGEKSRDCAWAWNFSGHEEPGRIEYVGVGDRKKGTIDFFVVENGAGRKVGNLTRFRGTFPKLTVCDLNDDGCMDVMYSGGVFAKLDITRVYVMYGKVKNVAGRKPGTRPVAAAGTAPGRPAPAPAPPAPPAPREVARAGENAEPEDEAGEVAAIPEGFALIHMKGGKKVLARNVRPCTSRVCYTTPDGKERSVSFGAVVRIQRP